MQPASMLGVGHVQGSSFVSNSQIVGGAGLHRGLDQLQPSQHPQSEQQVPGHPKMEDLTEMFSLPSWPEMGSMGRGPWDFNAGSSATAMSMEVGSGLSGPQKMFTMPLMSSGFPGGSILRQGLGSHAREVHGNMGQPHNNESLQYSSDDMLIAAQLNQQLGLRDVSSLGQSRIDGRIQTLSQGMQEAAHNALRRISEGSSRVLNRSPSVGSSGSDISGCQQLDSQSPSSVAPLWCQPYMGRVLSLPLGVGLTKEEPFIPQEGTPNEGHLLGKRLRDDEARAGPQESMFNKFGGAQTQQVRPTGQQMQVSATPYAGHTGLGQPQGAAAVAARPRVRARRGQATDPHSIAERLRRERIAERMKALQELVPNSNKTDKASMLDEIIDYVRFLQLQVKVLSMSRLGGAGAVAPLLADLPAEGQSNFTAAAMGRSSGASGSSQDGMAVAERHVARLMEEDMGKAMQFLQVKGLCLMPISLATAISSSNARPSTGSQSGLSGRVDASSSTTMASSNAISAGMAMPASSICDIVVDEATNAGLNDAWNSKEAPNAVGPLQSSSAVNSGTKIIEESVKTN